MSYILLWNPDCADPDVEFEICLESEAVERADHAVLHGLPLEWRFVARFQTAHQANQHLLQLLSNRRDE